MKKSIALACAGILLCGLLAGCTPKVMITGLNAASPQLTLAPGESTQASYTIAATSGDATLSVAFAEGTATPSEDADAKAVETLKAKTITWASDNTEVATVDESGTITGLAAGTAVVTLSIGDGENARTATIAVTVATLVEAITAPEECTLTVGATQTLAPQILPAGATDATLSYTSSDDAVVAVSGSGELKALAEGEATITITAEDKYNTGEKVTTTLRVIVNTPPESISLSKNEAWLTTGNSFTLTAIVGPENVSAPYTIIWTVSDESICTITPSKDGHSATIKAVKAGNVTITATLEGTDITATCSAGVSAPRQAGGGNTPAGNAPAGNTPAGGGSNTPSGGSDTSNGGGQPAPPNDGGQPIHGGEHGGVVDEGLDDTNGLRPAEDA